MSVDAGMAELEARMAQQAAAGPGLHVDVGAGLEVRIGRLVSMMEQERQRRALLSQMLNVIDLPPLDFAITAGQARFKGYRASGGDMSPQEGLMWFVQRVTLSGLNSGDAVNLHKTISSTFTANMTALHTFIAPPPSFLAPATVTQPAVPASTVAAQNTNTFPVQVVISGGTLTAVVVNGITVGSAAGTYTVPASGAISITYTVAPTWVWSPAASVSPVAAGLGVADWEPGTNGLVLRPDDQLYIVSAGTLTASEIILTGQAIQVDLRILADFLM